MKHQLRDEPQAWTYDANGNRLTQTGDQPSTYIVSGTSNRLSSISGAPTRSYAYNASGSVTGDGAATFTYDDAGHLIGEYDNSGALIHETVWLGDIPVATIRPNGASVDLFYVHADHLDTPRRISRPSDNVIVWRWDFDPYGTNAANQDPDGDTQAFVHGLRFPGQYLDSKTGLHYNYFRDYDPATVDTSNRTRLGFLEASTRTDTRMRVRWNSSTH